MDNYVIRSPTIQELESLFALQSADAQRSLSLEYLRDSFASYPNGILVYAVGQRILGFIVHELWDPSAVELEKYYAPHLTSEIQEPKGSLAFISGLTLATAYYLDPIGGKLLNQLTRHLFESRSIYGVATVIEKSHPQYEFFVNFYHNRLFKDVRTYEGSQILHKDR